MQLPLEPFGYPLADPGPRTLTTKASVGENIDSLQQAVEAYRTSMLESMTVRREVAAAPSARCGCTPARAT